MLKSGCRADDAKLRTAERLTNLIAAFCIENDYLLLHSDSDYDGFAAHRGLRVWGH